MALWPNSNVFTIQNVKTLVDVWRLVLYKALMLDYRSSALYRQETVTFLIKATLAKYEGGHEGIAMVGVLRDYAD